jgi:hypothetical protein
MADTDILLGGFGLFGGRGEYVGKIKLFDIGVDGGDQVGNDLFFFFIDKRSNELLELECLSLASPSGLNLTNQFVQCSKGTCID